MLLSVFNRFLMGVILGVIFLFSINKTKKLDKGLFLNKGSCQ